MANHCLWSFGGHFHVGSHLKAINSLLPLTTAESLTICYYFDLAQTCSSAAISRFLSLAADPDLLT